jgi:rhodanese-related sulfurtransferase
MCNDRGAVMMTGQPAVPTVDIVGAESEATTALLLDVREVSEWIHGHITGSVNVPLGQLADQAASLDRSRRIVCICRSGNRSSMATALLCDAGFDAVNMRGGMQAWAASGRPVVDRNGQPGVVA